MKPTGGPAFPQAVEEAASNAVHGKLDAAMGMTLRDYFAANAMPHWFGTGSPESRAKACYAEADAMLAERSKP